jgi:hypothetical protein
MRSDIAGCGDEDGVARQQVGNERGVEIHDWRQRIEWPFRQRAFRAAPVVEGDFRSCCK